MSSINAMSPKLSLYSFYHWLKNAKKSLSLLTKNRGDTIQTFAM